MNIIAHRRIYYAISIALLLPGLISLVLFGLRLGVDFTGGAVVGLRGYRDVSGINQVAEQHGFALTSVTASDGDDVLVSYRDNEQADTAEARHQAFHAELEQGGGSILSFEQVGPSVSSDVTRNALLSIGLVSLAIALYIAWAFRHIPPSVGSLSLGLITIIAMLHDVFFVLGSFAILGKFLEVEIDAFFVSALLTVMTFSIHDTIVVFDRIRENTLRSGEKDLDVVVNRSINEVMVRSLNTSIIVVMVLMALLLFAGYSIRYFTVALLLGMIAGTYSSIFVAAPLLVTYRSWKAKRS